MALSSANLVIVSQILQVTPNDLDAQMSWLGAVFTSAKQTAVEAQIALWATAGTKTTRLHPTESNKGVETRPDAARADIKNNIAILLERPDWAGVGGFQFQRG